MEMWLDVREKKIPWTHRNQEQVSQLIKSDAYRSAANASFAQQMSPSVEHIFQCLTGQSVFSVSAWNTQEV